MKFDTLRYGQIEIRQEDVFTFPEGLLGFPNSIHYAFMQEEGIHPFKILQSLDSPSLAFAVIDPLVVKSQYHFQLTKEDIAIIQAEDAENVSVYCIVNLGRSLREATINLQGPLVINRISRLGHQYVLFDENYSVSERLLSESLLPPIEESTKEVQAEDAKNLKKKRA